MIACLPSHSIVMSGTTTILFPLLLPPKPPTVENTCIRFGLCYHLLMQGTTTNECKQVDNLSYRSYCDPPCCWHKLFARRQSWRMRLEGSQRHKKILCHIPKGPKGYPFYSALCFWALFSCYPFKMKNKLCWEEKRHSRILYMSKA